MQRSQNSETLQRSQYSELRTQNSELRTQIGPAISSFRRPQRWCYGLRGEPRARMSDRSRTLAQPAERLLPILVDAITLSRREEQCVLAEEDAPPVGAAPRPGSVRYASAALVSAWSSAPAAQAAARRGEERRQVPRTQHRGQRRTRWA